MVLLDDFTTILRLWVNLDDLPIFNDNSFITKAVSYQPNSILIKKSPEQIRAIFTEHFMLKQQKRYNLTKNQR